MGVSHQPSVLLFFFFNRTLLDLNSGHTNDIRVTLKLGLGRYRHSVWSPTYRRAIKGVSKAVTLDWINNQACRLSPNIYVITNLFITNNYLFEMIRKIIFTNYFFWIYTPSRKPTIYLPKWRFWLLLSIDDLTRVIISYDIYETSIQRIS